MYRGPHAKYSLFLSELKDAEVSGQIFEKKTQISNFTKIRPVGAELCNADGYTDMPELIVAFRDFAYAPKSSYLLKYAGITVGSNNPMINCQ